MSEQEPLSIERMAAALEEQQSLRRQELEQARRTEAARLKLAEEKRLEREVIAERNHLLGQIIVKVTALVGRLEEWLAWAAKHKEESGSKLDVILYVLRAWLSEQMRRGGLSEDELAPILRILRAAGPSDVKVQSGGVSVESGRDSALDIEGDLVGQDKRGGDE